MPWDFQPETRTTRLVGRPALRAIDCQFLLACKLGNLGHSGDIVLLALEIIVEPVLNQFVSEAYQRIDSFLLPEFSPTSSPCFTAK